MNARSALVLFLCAACRQMSVDGTVVNAAGDPLQGALVQLNGTDCRGQTAADGAFSLSCAPGHHTLLVSAAEHHPEQLTVDATQRKSYPIAPIELLLEVPGDGLWLMSGASYAALPQDLLARTTDSTGTAYCALADPPSLEPVTTPIVRLVDQRAPAWRIFRLDEDGCAQRLVWRSGGWRITYADEPQGTQHPLGDGTMFSYPLSPGDYFVADWISDRFEVDRQASESAGAKRYSGGRLQVAAP